VKSDDGCLRVYHSSVESVTEGPTRDCTFYLPLSKLRQISLTPKDLTGVGALDLKMQVENVRLAGKDVTTI
jgi:hypothetical protein